MALAKMVTPSRLVKERMDVCSWILKWMREQAPAVDGNSVPQILGALQAAGFVIDDLACRRALRYLDLTRVIERDPRGQGYLLRSRT
jgi:hypothetical protein